MSLQRRIDNFFDRLFEWTFDKDNEWWRIPLVCLHALPILTCIIFGAISVLFFLGKYVLLLVPLSYVFWIVVIMRQTKKFEEENSPKKSVE